MNVAAAMAVRVQVALDELAALKARDPREVDAEERLAEKITELTAQLVDQIESYVDGHGLPTDPTLARQALGDLDDLSLGLLEALAEETAEDAAAAIANVEDKVAEARGAAKATTDPATLFGLGLEVDLDRLRPYGMDRKLFATLIRHRDRTLDRLTGSVVEALVDAAETGLPRDELAGALRERIDGQVRQITRGTVGQIRNEAVEVAEVDLGVTFHQWITVGDDRVRPAHAEVHRQIARVGGRFSNNWRRPGGVGCRCHLEPWFPPEDEHPPSGQDFFYEDELVRAA